jgi:hypothetical protein
MLQIGRSRNLGSIPGKIKICICSPKRADILWGPTKPPVQSGTRPLSLGAKLPRRKADQSSSSNIQLKNIWSYVSLPYTPSRCGATGSTLYFLHLSKTSTCLDFGIQTALLLFLRLQKNEFYNPCIHFRFRILLVKANANVIEWPCHPSYNESQRDALFLIFI